MMATETIEVEGHIIDSLVLAKVLDMIVDSGADYRMVDVEIGKTNVDPSRVRLEVIADNDDALRSLVAELRIHGANPVDQADAVVVPAEVDGVLPDGFYATTNLPTEVRLDRNWVEVDNPEMDCALVVLADGRVRAEPMHRVHQGDAVVVGEQGVRVRPLDRLRGGSPFEFMTSEVSSEKPKDLLVAQVADRIRAARARGGKVLAVCGPAVIHTGAGPALAGLVRRSMVNLVFAGNGFAAHDIESNVLGTSLGVAMRAGPGAHGHGHSNHLRAINEVRRRGSIAAAVDDGYLSGGVMFECVKAGVPFVLGGSVRDDGPLPDVHTDVVEAADAMRALLPGVSVALMLASTLHAIATGNLLPAGVETYCVDINQAVVTKLADRGSHQALGIVTDVGLFLETLSDHLAT